jgi:predicted outer membrane lipoprotein
MNGIEHLISQYQLASRATKNAARRVWRMTSLVEVSPMGFADPGTPRVGHLLSAAITALRNEHEDAMKNKAEAAFGDRKTDLPPHNRTNIVVFPTQEERNDRRKLRIVR